jgi:hypothetical protein
MGDNEIGLRERLDQLEHVIDIAIRINQMTMDSFDLIVETTKTGFKDIEEKFLMLKKDYENAIQK